MNVAGLENNKVIVCGKIISELKFSHEIYGEGFYTFNVEIPRLSDYHDVLPVTISERLITDIKLNVGTQLKIIGQFRSYNKYVDGSNRLILTIFVKDISLDCKDISNPNQIYLDGYICKPTVYRTTPFKREITDILLAVNRAYNKSDYIPAIAWGRNARFSDKLKVGDRIKIWGRIQSREYQKRLDNGDVICKTAYEVSISKMEKCDKDKT